MSHSQRTRRSSRRRPRPQPQQRPLVEPNAAGIDVGARQMYVAIPPDRDQEPVRVFSTFTQDLEALADWLLQRGITTAAMESTGVYWIPLYQILEDRGIKVCLTSARNMCNVPGRRTGLAGGCNTWIRWGCCGRRFVPSSRSARGALADAASRAAGGERLRSGSADAEIADADERTIASRDQRPDGGDGDGDRRRDPGAGSATRRSWRGCGGPRFAPARRRSANLWRGIGERSICSRSSRRGSSTAPSSGRSRSATARSRGRWGSSSHGWTPMSSLRRRGARSARRGGGSARGIFASTRAGRRIGSSGWT